ncbi:MAG: biopolymer transporter ExbD [Terricaulis sp.]
MATAIAKRSKFAPSAEPNVIPFIDVPLVLLIIFMVTAPKPTTDLQVDMPPPGPPIAQQIKPTVVDVHRGAAGAEYSIGGEPLTLDQLGDAALAAMMAADRRVTTADAHYNGRIYVRADLDVGYQGVVSAVDALAQARFRKVSIARQDADAPA